MQQIAIPDGMSRIEESQIMGGLQALYGDVAFSPIAATTFTGSDGGNAICWMPGGSLVVVQKLNQNLNLGFFALNLKRTYRENTWPDSMRK